MRASARSVIVTILVAGAAAWLILRYLDHRREVALERDREAPVVAPSRVTEHDGAAVVALDGAEAGRIGLRLAVLQAATGERESRFTAEVVTEAERVAVLRAPLPGRLTVPQGSRWPGLGERVRRGVPIGQVSDARPLELPIAGVVTRVGAQPGALVEAGQVLLEVADYSRPLVRVAWTGEGVAPSRVSLATDDRGPRVPARLIGPAPEADPVTRRAAYLYRAEHGWPGGTPGAAAVAIATTRTAGGSPGVLVPDSAVVQWEGLAWAYRRRDAGRYERVRVETTTPVPGGWVVSGPLSAGDSVVIQGAQELLSEEFRARVTVGDESGE
jgi:hypothetical protein